MMFGGFESCDVDGPAGKLRTLRGGAGGADVAMGHKLQQAVRVLWGEHGAVGQCFDVLEPWHERAANVSGQSLPCDHYIAEVAPDMLLTQALEFFKN